jgi:hypothetical protein
MSTLPRGHTRWVEICNLQISTHASQLGGVRAMCCAAQTMVKGAIMIYVQQVGTSASLQLPDLDPGGQYPHLCAQHRPVTALRPLLCAWWCCQLQRRQHQAPGGSAWQVAQRPPRGVLQKHAEKGGVGWGCWDMHDPCRNDAHG